MSLLKYEAEWEKNARLDPMFSILAAPEGRGQRWDPDRFFATGLTEVERVFAHLARVGGLPARPESFLDFGCGIGRVSQALSRRFASGKGVDISSHMVNLARQYNHPGSGLEFIKHRSVHIEVVPTASMSFVYCHLVLQHISNPLQRRAIVEFTRALEPAGVCAFQIPTERLESPLPPSQPSLISRMLPGTLKDNIKRALGMQTHLDMITMEMNSLPDPEVTEILEKGRCDLIAMHYTNSTETDHKGRIEFFDRKEAIARIQTGRAKSKFLSSFYVARKRGEREGLLF
jgi:SAM-dependent methyltransferase